MARMGRQYQQAQSATRSARHRGISDVAIGCHSHCGFSPVFWETRESSRFNGLHSRKPLETVGICSVLLVQRAEATVLMRRQDLTASKRSYYIQLWRKNNQIGLRSDDQTTLRFETDSASGIFRRHRDSFI